jgi:putative aldouronate transport system permease protein
MNGVKSKEEKRFQLFWKILFILISIIALIPIIRVISMSLSSKNAILSGKVFLYPVEFTLDAYKKAIKSGSFTSSFLYSVVLMVISTVISMVMTVLAAYPLSKKKLKGAGVIMT